MDQSPFNLLRTILCLGPTTLYLHELVAHQHDHTAGKLSSQPLSDNGKLMFRCLICPTVSFLTRCCHSIHPLDMGISRGREHVSGGWRCFCALVTQLVIATVRVIHQARSRPYRGLSLHRRTHSLAPPWVQNNAIMTHRFLGMYDVICVCMYEVFASMFVIVYACTHVI